MALTRRGALQAAGLGGFAAIAARLGYIDLVRAPEAAEEGRLVRLRHIRLRALRGQIRDRRDSVLASSVIVYDVGVNQVLVSQYEHKVYNAETNQRELVGHGALEAAAQLAPLLGEDPLELGARMVGDSTYTVIASAIDPVVWRRVQALNIQGIEPDQRVRRTYPSGKVAGNVIGYAYDGEDEATGDRLTLGGAGLELSQNDLLTGTDGYTEYEASGLGVVIPSVPETTEPAVEGASVRTTLDSDLQRSVQSSVDAAKTRWGATWVSVLVTDPATGEVLVMADSNTLDPSHPGDSALEDTRSRSIEAVYEPGSVGKVVTFAAALEEGTITPDDTWTVPDEWTAPNGQSFQDSHSHETETMTSTRVLVDSSNVGTVQIGDTLSDGTRHRYMRLFGWGEASGIEMPAESAGILTEASQWDDRQRYTTMFGQGVACTPLQSVQTLATIANKGVRVPCRLISAWVGPDGEEVAQTRPEGVRVVSEATAATLTEMLIGVTQKGGTAQEAGIDGYLVAGKTGTTQILAPDGADQGTVASFVGFLPARAPAVAISVVVYQPASGVYGGTVAAPLFREVALAAMHSLGISPDPSVVAAVASEDTA